MKYTNLHSELERATWKSNWKPEKETNFGVALLQALIALPIIYFIAWMILGWN